MKKGEVFICDSCGSEAFSQLSANYWYGSKHDMTQWKLHLCDDCANNAIKELEKILQVHIKLEDITEL